MSGDGFNELTGFSLRTHQDEMIKPILILVRVGIMAVPVMADNIQKKA